MTTLTQFQKKSIELKVSTLPILTLMLLKNGSVGALVDLASPQMGGGTEDFDEYVVEVATKQLNLIEGTNDDPTRINDDG